MQWVDKGNEHCPYCRENMISAQDLSDTATEVVGEERVAKLQRINQEAALRVAALTASGTRTISEVVPPVGRAPATTQQQANFPVVSTPPSPAGAVVLESAEAYQTEEADEAETNPEAESSITNNEVEQRSARPSVEDEVADTEEESEESSSSDGNTAAGSSNDETAEPSSTPTPWEKEADTVSAEGTGDAGPSKDVATKGTAEETQ